MHVLWLHVLSTGACPALPLDFMCLAMASWRWYWPCLVGVCVVLLRVCSASRAGVLAVLWSVTLVCWWASDWEVVFLSHWASVRLGRVLAAVHGVLVLSAAAGGLGQFWAGLLGGCVAGLVWSVQVFCSLQWWSAADRAEYASLGMLGAVAGLAHCAVAWQRWLPLVTLVACVLACWGTSAASAASAVYAVVHSGAAQLRGLAALSASLCVAGTWFARRYSGVVGARVGGITEVAMPRAACYGSLVFGPCSVGMLSVGAVVSSRLLALALLTAVCGRPALLWGCAGVHCALAVLCASGPWVGICWCWLSWSAGLWWLHLVITGLGGCVLVVGSSASCQYAGCGVAAVLALLFLVLCLQLWLVRNFSVRWLWDATLLSP